MYIICIKNRSILWSSSSQASGKNNKSSTVNIENANKTLTLFPLPVTCTAASCLKGKRLLKSTFYFCTVRGLKALQSCIFKPVMQLSWSCLFSANITHKRKIAKQLRLCQNQHSVCSHSVNCREQLAWTLSDKWIISFGSASDCMCWWSDGMKVLVSIFMNYLKRSFLYKAVMALVELSGSSRALTCVNPNKVIQYKEWLGKCHGRLVASQVTLVVTNLLEHFPEVNPSLQFSHHQTVFSKCQFGWHFH